LGFDCGPGNALLDAWCLQHTGQPYDAEGRWAASGKVHAPLLVAMLQEPYFALPPPKSTGRDLFHPTWLAHQLTAFSQVTPADVQATLTELTARCCADALLRHGADSRRLIVCGGGALNNTLMQSLQTLLSSVKVLSSAQEGLPPLQVEAAAFAWLARRAMRGETGNLQSVTGARGTRVLGAIYPA
jgi:anhydro-N-acetylmuramic acid kinase